jgi:hypothetical protein
MIIVFKCDPVIAKPTAAASDKALAAQLWQRSEELTHVHYAPVTAPLDAAR